MAHRSARSRTARLLAGLAVLLLAAACSSGGSGPSGSASGSGSGSSDRAGGGATATDAGSAPGAASPSSSAPASATVWLCRPGLADDPCTADRDATSVAADGTRTVESSHPTGEPPIDCFYVYPTVSKQPGPNATLAIDPEERQVAFTQASRFSRACRVFAPMYRQLTLSALGGKATAENRAIAYGDVQSAWDDYLAHDNHGRGVVLIGHSQGAGMLDQLLKNRIDKDPKVRRQLVSALLIGGNVLVPVGKDVGADFANVPACRSRTQLGCVVAYSTFDQPPPDDTLFGRPRSFSGQTTAGAEVLCTNPADLAGGSAPLHPYVPVAGEKWDLAGAALAPPPDPSLSTPWVTYPDLWTARCTTSNGANVLLVTDVRKPGDDRPHLVDSLGASWGLHLLDVNLPLGDLVSLVEAQSAAYTKAR